MNSKAKYIARIGMLTAVAFLLQIIPNMFAFPKIGGFLEMEISDFPAIIATFAMGPMAGVLTELLKNALHLTITSTGGVGELANFVINGSFVLIAGLIYSRNKTKKGAIIALISATVGMVLAAMLANYFIMLPLYMKSAPSSVKLNLILATITPFNFVRGVVLSIITAVTYKYISPLLRK